LQNRDKDRLILPVLYVMARRACIYGNYMDAIAEIKDNNMIVLPDLDTCFTISDPTTYVNLLKLLREYLREL
jgi:hypothetical protein